MSLWTTPIAPQGNDHVSMGSDADTADAGSRIGTTIENEMNGNEYANANVNGSDARPDSVYMYAPRLTPLQYSSVTSKVKTVSFANAAFNGSSDVLLAFGAWGNHCNTISIHTLHTDYSHTYGMNDGASIADTEADIAIEHLSTSRAEYKVTADVNAIQFCNEDRFLISGLSNGSVSFLQVDFQSESFDPRSLPNSSAPHASISPTASFQAHTNTLSLDSSSESAIAVSSGEEGSICLYDLKTFQIVQQSRPLGAALRCSKQAGRYMIYTISASGRVLLFDNRIKLERPVAVTSHSSRSSPTYSTLPSGLGTSLAVHPSRFETLAAGDSSGCISMFDLRSGRSSLCSLEDHRGPVWDVHFLPFDPSTVLSAGEDGQLLLYDFNRLQMDPSLVRFEAASKPQLVSIASQMHAFNSIDIERSSHTVIATTDGMQVVHCQFLFA